MNTTHHRRPAPMEASGSSEKRLTLNTRLSTIQFEVLSPNHTALEMMDKFNAYSRFGVEEYFLFDPEEQ